MKVKVIFLKTEIMGEARIVMSNPNGKAKYFGWPSITRLQNGRLAVVASGFRYAHVCPFGKLVISYSEDNGETYTSPAILIDTPLDDRDGGIMTFGKSGVIVTSFNNELSFQRAINRSRGATDEKAMIESYLNTVTPEEEAKYLGAEFRISNDCGVTFGEILKSPITSPHGPTELSDKSILWVGRTFSSGDNFMGEADELRAYRVYPDGRMELLGVIPSVFLNGEKVLSCEPHAIETADGSIICHFRVEVYPTGGKERVFTTFQSISKDGGRSWSEPRQLLGRVGGAPAHLLHHSSGTLISVYGCRDNPYGVGAMFSTDNGETWDIGHSIYTSPSNDGDLGYPCTVELEDGSLLTVFYAHPYKDSSTAIMQQRWKMID